MDDTAALLAALRAMGLSADAARAYGELVASGPLARAELVERCGDAPAISAGVDELMDAGLVGVAGADGSQLSPAAPLLGLDVLSRQRAAAIDQARLDIVTAYESYRRKRPALDELGIEAVTGEAIGWRMRQVWRAAADTIEQFDTPPYVVIPGALDDSLHTLGRGVAQRVVYARASFADEDYFREAIEPAVLHGEEARVCEEVPLKLILVDRRLAMISASLDGAESHHTMYVVTNGVVLRALVGLFESVWAAALPLGSRLRDGDSRLHGTDRNLLAMLASGLRDDEISRQVGISRRTLSRRLELLMARAGASSRFQLALQAERRGWI